MKSKNAVWKGRDKCIYSPYEMMVDYAYIMHTLFVLYIKFMLLTEQYFQIAFPVSLQMTKLIHKINNTHTKIVPWKDSTQIKMNLRINPKMNKFDDLMLSK